MKYLSCPDVIKLYNLKGEGDFPGCCGSCHHDEEEGLSDLSETTLPNGDIAYTCCGWTSQLKQAINQQKGETPCH